MKRIRAGSGLGDSIYLRAICEHFMRRGEWVVALSDWPQVFIGSGVVVERFTRNNVDVVAHYTHGKGNPETTQWQDVCIAAGLRDLPLGITWEVRNRPLVDRVRAAARGKRVVLVHGGRTPMGRTDGFGAELLPERDAFEAVLGAARADCYLVRFGQGEQLYPLDVDEDITDGTTVPDLFDLASTCDGVIAQCSLAIPLAEVFDKPLLVVWSSRGLMCSTAFIRVITPAKVLCKPTSRFVIDNWAPEAIDLVVDAFRADFTERIAA